MPYSNKLSDILGKIYVADFMELHIFNINIPSNTAGVRAHLLQSSKVEDRGFSYYIPINYLDIVHI